MKESNGSWLHSAVCLDRGSLRNTRWLLQLLGGLEKGRLYFRNVLDAAVAWAGAGLVVKQGPSGCLSLFSAQS